MHVIDKATREGSYLRVFGWCFKAGARTKAVFAEADGKRFAVEKHGLDSKDVAQHYGEYAQNARFDIKVETPSSACVLEFVFDNGAVSRIPVDLSGEPEKLTALEHRIHQGIYSGKFCLTVAAPIVSVHFLPQSDAHNKRTEAVAFSELREEQGRIISINTAVPEEWDTKDLGILITTTQQSYSLSSIASTARSKDASHQICARFFDWLCQSTTPLKVAEIGSRARSGISRRHQFGERNDYIGFDILKGPNVDVVGDIHALTKSFSPASLDAIAGFSVFEHVAMPWKAAIELNKVLKPGGRCMFFTHQAWPVHESPYDFWRYSTDSWRALFNRATGFRILDSACGGEANIHPLIQNRRGEPFEKALAFTSSSVLVEKTSETRLTWDVDLDDVHQGAYPT